MNSNPIKMVVPRNYSEHIKNSNGSPSRLDGENKLQEKFFFSENTATKNVGHAGIVDFLSLKRESLADKVNCCNNRLLTQFHYPFYFNPYIFPDSPDVNPQNISIDSIINEESKSNENLLTKDEITKFVSDLKKKDLFFSHDDLPDDPWSILERQDLTNRRNASNFDRSRDTSVSSDECGTINKNVSYKDVNRTFKSKNSRENARTNQVLEKIEEYSENHLYNYFIDTIDKSMRDIDCESLWDSYSGAPSFFEEDEMIEKLLTCRELEKKIEEQHTIIDMLEQDICEAEQKLRLPPEVRAFYRSITENGTEFIESSSNIVRKDSYPSTENINLKEPKALALVNKPLIKRKTEEFDSSDLTDKINQPKLVRKESHVKRPFKPIPKRPTKLSQIK